MSVQMLTVVLNHSLAVGSEKLVLVGIADHDGDGGSWPSVATLARYAGAQPRAVQKLLEKLVQAGELIVHRQDGGTARTPDHMRTNRYEITLRCSPECDGSRHAPIDESMLRDRKFYGSPDRVSPRTPPVPGDTRGVSPRTPAPLSPGTPEPSFEPPREDLAAPSKVTSPAPVVEQSAAEIPEQRQPQEDDPRVAARGVYPEHTTEDNAAKSLRNLSVEADVNLTMLDLMTQAYRIGCGNPWWGYLKMKPTLQAEYPGARDRSQVIRAALRSMQPEPRVEHHRPVQVAERPVTAAPANFREMVRGGSQ